MRRLMPITEVGTRLIEGTAQPVRTVRRIRMFDPFCLIHDD